MSNDKEKAAINNDKILETDRTKQHVKGCEAPGVISLWRNNNLLFPTSI